MKHPTNYRIRQEWLEAEVEFEGEGKSTEFIAAIVAGRLGIEYGDVSAALGDARPRPLTCDEAAQVDDFPLIRWVKQNFRQHQPGPEE